MLPSPFKPERRHIVRKAVNDEDHIPWAFIRGPPSTAKLCTPIMLTYPPVRICRLPDIGPALVPGIEAVQEVHSEEILHLLSMLGYGDLLA